MKKYEIHCGRAMLTRRWGEEVRGYFLTGLEVNLQALQPDLKLVNTLLYYPIRKKIKR